MVLRSVVPPYATESLARLPDKGPVGLSVVMRGESTRVADGGARARVF
jgi:hypothetical protein